MKSTSIIALACTFLTVSNVFAGTINFDNAPLNTDVGMFYQGITFGGGEQAVNPPSANFPTSSGTQELWNSNPNTPIMLFTFLTAQSQFSFNYSSVNGFAGVALNSLNQVVGTFVGLKDPGASLSVGLTHGVADITTIELIDTGHVGSKITVDDLSAPGLTGLSRAATTPDTASTFGLFGVAALGLWAFRRKMAVQQ
jgi:hypothetical protein